MRTSRAIPSPTQQENRTHYATISLGCQFRAGWLRFTPELIFSYGAWEYLDASETQSIQVRKGVYFILPSISFGAGF